MEAKNYIEDLQGLLLFMHLKRQKIISLSELKELDKIVRDDLIDEFKKVEHEILAWHNASMDRNFKDLLAKHIAQIQENEEKLSVEEMQIQISETEAYIESRKAKNTPSKFQDKISYSIIEPKLEEISKAATSLGIKNAPNVLLATLYTEQVNAVAMRMKKTGEYIICFESQLFSFLNRFVKIIVLSIPEVKTNDPDKFGLCFLKEEVEKHVKEFPLIKALFTDLIFSFAVGGNVNDAQNFDLDFGRNIHATYILRATELFVMGHEYGHIVKGHLTTGLNSEIEIANLTAEEIERKWENEYEADTLGLFFMIKVLHDEHFMEDFSLIGADLFFILTEITEKARSIIKFGHENGSGKKTNHPPAKLRRENLRKAYLTSFTPQQLKKAETMPIGLEGVLEHLWNETKPLLFNYYDKKLK